MAAKKKSKAQLPKGFKPISGGGGGAWEFKKEPVLEGTLVSIREFESKFKDPATKKYKVQKAATIERKDGSQVTVFESAGTRALFDVKKGKRVAIVYEGTMKIKGRAQPMKLFQVGVA